jgi:hypothetical protein
MSVFRWIEDDDGPSTPYSDLAEVDVLLMEIYDLMAWENDPPNAVGNYPTFAQLETGAAYALSELAKAESKHRMTLESRTDVIADDEFIQPIDLLLGHMDESTEEDLSRDYPDDLPKNQIFVLAALALVYVDQAIGHLLYGEAVKAVNAMAKACSAVHAASFFNGQDQGIAWLRRTNSSKGGEARNAPYKQLQDWAKDLYRAKTWKSPHQASHELKDEILAHARTLGVSLSPYRAQQTIYSWFLAAGKTKAQE